MLVRRGSAALPPPVADRPNAFDHGDVHRATGHVFVAHTAANTVEVINGEHATHIMTIPECPEGSGVLCAQEEGLIFAAARAGGKVLVIEASSGRVLGDVLVGPQPNGLAWDTDRKRLLVADVRENTARLLDVRDAFHGRMLAATPLPGRPRWCVYDHDRTRFLVNIREPASVVVLAATGEQIASWEVSSAGPHGLDVDVKGARAFIACDAGRVIALDLETGRELAQVAIAGPPDAIWYNAQHERLYVAIAEPGVVDVVNTRTMTIEEEVMTELGAHTTAYDEQRQRLYVFLPAACRADVYDEVAGPVS